MPVLLLGGDVDDLAGPASALPEAPVVEGDDVVPGRGETAGETIEPDLLDRAEPVSHHHAGGAGPRSVVPGCALRVPGGEPRRAPMGDGGRPGTSPGHHVIALRPGLQHLGSLALSQLPVALPQGTRGPGRSQPGVALDSVLIARPQAQTPSPAVRPRPGGRSARVRTAVLQATLEELAETGYAALSLESVARRAGVHKTSLYRRWGTRDSLVLDAVLERAGQWVSIPDTGSVRQDLLELAREIIANISTPEMEAIIRAFVAEAPRESALASRGREFWAARFADDRQIVQRGIDRDELPADTDPDLVIEALLGPLCLRLLVTGQPLDMAFVERVVDLILAGLQASKDHR